jgi:phosphoglycolate phosphatase-like HAD superfamily hydrolase
MHEASAIAEDLRLETERQPEATALTASINEPQAKAAATYMAGDRERDYRRGIRAGLWTNAVVGVLTDAAGIREDILQWLQQN